MKDRLTKFETSKENIKMVRADTSKFDPDAIQRAFTALQQDSKSAVLAYIKQCLRIDLVNFDLGNEKEKIPLSSIKT